MSLAVTNPRQKEEEIFCTSSTRFVVSVLDAVLDVEILRIANNIDEGHFSKLLSMSRTKFLQICSSFTFPNFDTPLNDFKHGAILYNEAEVLSLPITNPNRRPMLRFDWLINSVLILARCHKILKSDESNFLFYVTSNQCFLDLMNDSFRRRVDRGK